jgi:guanosine-3',5'-bis(diphosphate) 3'-pyrophosphohydrolase
MTLFATVADALDFAAGKHAGQLRKDEQSPYINHVIAVVRILAVEGRVSEETVLAAAALHDTVEDTATTFEEIDRRFGPVVASFVREMTDDKSLPKQVRKDLQVEHARTASIGAKQIKIADKVANIRDIVTLPPVNWPLARKIEYFAWAEQVVAGCRGVNERLDKTFDAAAMEARRRVGNW